MFNPGLKMYYLFSTNDMIGKHPDFFVQEFCIFSPENEMV